MSLVFQTPSEMIIKGIKKRYAELMALLNTFKDTVKFIVHINLNCECGS